MSNSYRKKIEHLCKGIAKYRAGGRCELCRRNECTEGHHLFEGKWKAYWQLWSNPDNYLGLDFYCHQEADYAPKKDPHKFWALVEAKLRLRAPDRLHRILETKWNLDHGRHPQDIKKPDYPKIIAYLNEEYKRWENIYELDKDSQRHWGQIV